MNPKQEKLFGKDRTHVLAALTDTVRAIIRRHGGVADLARRLVEILGQEGVRGIAFRLRFGLYEPAVTNALERGSADQQGDPISKPRAKSRAPSAPRRECTALRSEPPEVRRDLLPGVLLVGHPYGVLGRGEDVRTAACACESASIPFTIRNTFGECGREDASRHKDFPLMDRISASRFHQANVFFLNADEMEKASWYLGPDFFRGRYNIGCWQWELSRFPDEWVDALRFLDEIWAPSRFVQQALSEKAGCPVVRMPLAVECTETVRLSRNYFGLPDQTFLFLFFFDFRSYVTRKNPRGAIEAFRRAFPDGDAEPVGLVIKINGTEACPDAYRAFRKMGEICDRRVIVLDRVMDDREMNELVRLCDCFVSLHRSEGFGRGLAEAMFFGKPVVATGYSGNLDFTNELNACLVDYVLVPVKAREYPFGEGQLWADPDAEQAARYMRRLVAEPAYAAEIGKNGEQYIKTHHSFQAVGLRWRHRLERLKLI
jgi:glycosyltransferase involved in cell wall biosynthesis